MSEFLEYFDDYFPEIAREETRYARLVGRNGIPDGEYALMEAYCTDPSCDCQNMMLAVVRYKEGFVAAIRVILARDGTGARAFPDPCSARGEHVESILRWMQSEVLSDPQYIARLEHHCQMMKRLSSAEEG